MTNIIFTVMMIFSYVVLYSLLGVIIAGSYHMIAAKMEREKRLNLVNDAAVVGAICTIWPMFLLIIILAIFASPQITKLGELICSWFVVNDGTAVKKEENQ